MIYYCTVVVWLCLIFYVSFLLSSSSVSLLMLLQTKHNAKYWCKSIFMSIPSSLTLSTSFEYHVHMLIMLFIRTLSCCSCVIMMMFTLPPRLKRLLLLMFLRSVFMLLSSLHTDDAMAGKWIVRIFHIVWHFARRHCKLRYKKAHT